MKKRRHIDLSYTGCKKSQTAKNIHDLPNEVFYEGVFRYLTDVDVLNFGRTGNRKFEMISEEYLECKHWFKFTIKAVNSTIDRKK